ncbi:MAG: hypothetical protein KJ949_01335, partial [Nanoarchaeota archaeon]|nr:hypothetical protein [Nanoarchaeota archaeon]
YCLENLIKKGLATYSLIANKKHFQATSPEQLIELIDNKKKELKKILPELKELQSKTEERIETNIYEGYKGVKGIYDKILRELKKGDIYYVIGARQIGDETNKPLNDLIINFHNQREKKGIKVKIIFNKDLKEGILKSIKGFKNIDYKFTDSKTNSYILVYKNKVINFLYTEKLLAIEIISEDVSNSYKQFFNEIWKD